MVQFYEEIPDYLLEWIPKQQAFWVASAPLDPNGHVNLSTKGIEGTFHVVDKNTVWYEDLSGSGIETISHIRENGRITVLFNAFEGPPRIVRLFGRGNVFEFGTPEYDSFIPPTKRHPGSRSVILVNVHKVASSCGYAVPLYEFKAHRTKLLESYERREQNEIKAELPNGSPEPDGSKVDDGLRKYWLKANMHSLDGLPGLSSAPYTALNFRNGGIPSKENAGTGWREALALVTDTRFLVGISVGIAASATGLALLRKV